MPMQKTVTVYTFDELTPTAQERAKAWFREGLEFEPDMEDVETIAKILGIDFYTRDIALMGGGTRQESRIFYSGFSSQGDGACFEASFKYARGMSKAIRAHAGQDKELHRIADALTALYRRSFYQLAGSCAHAGRYYHSGTMRFDIERLDGLELSAGMEEDLSQLMRDFADWIYKSFEADYDWQMSDSNVRESINANEYTFTETGHID